MKRLLNFPITVLFLFLIYFILSIRNIYNKEQRILNLSEQLKHNNSARIVSKFIVYHIKKDTIIVTKDHKKSDSPNPNFIKSTFSGSGVVYVRKTIRDTVNVNDTFDYNAYYSSITKRLSDSLKLKWQDNDILVTLDTANVIVQKKP